MISKSQPNPLRIKFQLCPRFSFIPFIPISRLNNDESEIEVTGPNLKKNSQENSYPPSPWYRRPAVYTTYTCRIRWGINTRGTATAVKKGGAKWNGNDVTEKGVECGACALRLTYIAVAKNNSTSVYY